MHLPILVPLQVFGLCLFTALTTGSNGVPVTRLQAPARQRPASSFPPRSPPNAQRGSADSVDEKASEPGSQGSVCRLIFFLLGT